MYIIVFKYVNLYVSEIEDVFMCMQSSVVSSSATSVQKKGMVIAKKHFLCLQVPPRLITGGIRDLVSNIQNGLEEAMQFGLQVNAAQVGL